MRVTFFVATALCGTALAAWTPPIGTTEVTSMPLDQQTEITTEALALFVRFWLTANPPLPDSGLAAAQAQGKERYEGFVEALARRLEGRSRLGDFNR